LPKSVTLLQMTKVNKDALKERHKKLYEGQYHSWIGRAWFHVKKGLKKVWYVVKPSQKKFSRFMHPLDHMPAPRRLYSQLSIFSIGLLLIMSINTTSAYSVGQGLGLEYESLALEIGSSYVTDDEGYIIKNMPLEGEAVYDQNRTEMAKHEVQSGETLSVIAYRYGISVDSIIYSNKGVTASGYLKVGQELDIPPEDGLYVTIEGGDSLVSIVEDYDGDIDQTKEFNGFNDDSNLIAGNEIFIIDGEPEQVYVAAAVSNDNSYSSTAYEAQTIYYDVAPNAEGWIRPTSGIITQGYHAGHYAYDIADRSKPAIKITSLGS